MEDLDALRGLPRSPPPEDTLSLSLSTTDSINIEDGHYSALQADLEADACDLDRESWSVSVDQLYIKTLPKDTVKRQDVIYELIQTEVHHVRTLKLLSVYRYELRHSLQVPEPKLERMFPQLDRLLQIHQQFLYGLRERRDEQNHYVVTQLGEILISQFSGEIGDRMKLSYGLFCSHHTDAVSFYKDQLQNNKKFQNLITKISRLSIVRRLGVPECILLVTQRITKYPVLVERILQNTEADTEEHGALTQALVLIKETISAVDSQVHDYERAFKLDDIINRLDPRSFGKLKKGPPLSRDDLKEGSRTLIHEGTVNWRAANGRLKEIYAVLLSDILLLMQKEKDQKITFANLDNKPSVISLQVLIMRELAHDDNAMYLISDSSSFPEMYEIHATSKEERNVWMSLIRDAVDSCPTEQEDAMLAVLREFQERMYKKDAQVMQSLTEKLQLLAEMAEAVAGLGDVANHSHLLFHGDASDLQQGATLLNGIITEVEGLQILLLSNVTKRDPNPAPEDQLGPGGLGLRLRELRHDPPGLGNLVALSRAKTFGGYDCNLITPTKNGSIPQEEWPGTVAGRPLDRRQHSNSDPQLQDFDPSEGSEMSLLDRLQRLSQKLYSLLAIVSQQDSYIEMQRATLAEYERSWRPCGNVLLEKEKQRNLEKQREEMANFHKLQIQHKQEQARWEKELERQHRKMEGMDAELRRREEECTRLEEKLAEERGELERQREAYQKDLERLRESAQTVEKEKERLDQQMKLKKNNSILGFSAQQSHSSRDYLIHSASFHGDPHYSLSPRENISHSQSFHVEDLTSRRSPGGDVTSRLSSRVHSRPSFSPNPDAPPIPPRRESISPVLPKAEVPLHLISTTNQVVHKAGVIQQQIPTKLAAPSSKAKEKTSKKGSHHRTHSAASIDISQVIPIIVIGKESGSLKGKKKKKKMNMVSSGL
ncbi:rho guanine nucleotide exchange factor 18 isoform X2 [Esox lucius]|uniref:rho guanine nucleotide exchange factor 18 isoform X2 n=1 Tax=Esox lucius TaxID=8010 RepID=UPI00147762D1|nr:rho guanine nucleotide exchange factor 18 isoform X2 [Esox lucius]